MAATMTFVERWSIGLDAWIIQDGNYPDFFTGQHAEFAVEFYFPEPPELIGEVAPTARPAHDATYDIDGRVIAILDKAWVIDCGISVFQVQRAPAGIALGDTVRGRVYLGVDPFFYFERLHSLIDMPALIYTWRLDEIARQTAPFVKTGNVLARDPVKLGWKSLERTDAWHDDEGNANYLFKCTLLDVPPKRSSATST